MDYYEKYKNIVIDRRGDVPNSNMTTLDIIDVVKPNIHYKITLNSLLKTKFKLSNHPITTHINKDDVNHVEIKNNWN